MSPTLSDSLLNALVKEVVRKPESLYWMLKTWEPSMESSAMLLQILTEKISPKRWIKQQSQIMKQVLSELIRIDDGRGIIADWLALIVRDGDNLSVLSIAAEWYSRKYHFTDRLLDAWQKQSFSGSNAKKALEVMVNAILPSDMSPERMEGRKWNEERRAEVILKHLAEGVWHADMENIDIKDMLDKLQILADWQPSPELHGKTILSEIFSGWERHMQDVAKIMMKDKVFASQPIRSVYFQQTYLRLTWKGLLTLSRYCVGADSRILYWMEYWLDHGDTVSSATMDEMAKWNSPDETGHEQVAVLWSRYLLSPHGYENPTVWAAVGKYFAGCQKPGRRMKEISHNYVTALGFVAKMPVWKDREKTEVLKAIVRPPWLMKGQLEEWKTLWTNLMQSSSRATIQVAVRHLLELVTVNLADRDAVKGVILKRLENMNADAAAEITGGLLEAIGEWEGKPNSPGEILYDVCVKLRQSPWWHIPEIRQETARAVAMCLKSNPGQGKTPAGLVALWLEIMREERDPAVICSLLEDTVGITKVYPDLYPVVMKTWKDWGQAGESLIRRRTWRLFSLSGDDPGNEIGMFLVKRLREEDDPVVLHIMAEWRPSPGKPFPPGFGEGWADCFQALARDRNQFLISGKLWNFSDKLGLVKYFIRTLITAWLEERFESDRQCVKLTVLQEFHEKMTEAMKSFSSSSQAYQPALESLQKTMEVLLRLDKSPEEFLKGFAEVRETGAFSQNEWMWWDLVKIIEGRDMSFLSTNVRHNLGVVVASLLSADRAAPKRNMVIKIFAELCGDGTWTPDRIPAGWEAFCREFHLVCRKYDRESRLSDWEMGKICTLIGIGHKAGDARCHHLFRQTLFQVLKSTNPDLATVVGSALRREVLKQYQMVEQSGVNGNGLDRAGQQRWLREFLRSCGQTTVGDEESGTPLEFLNSLWKELNGGLFLQKTTRWRTGGQVKVPLLSRRDAVFVHLHRDGNPLSEGSDTPAEKIQKKSRQQSELLPFQH